MKHHNKFKVTTLPEGNGMLGITFSNLGPINQSFTRENQPTYVCLPYNGATELEALLNATYDDAYERGRNAVRVCMNEAMGFDGE